MRTPEERAQAALDIKKSRTWDKIKTEITEMIEEKRSSKTFESSSIFGVQVDVLLEFIDNIENKHIHLAHIRQESDNLSPNDFK